MRIIVNARFLTQKVTGTQRFAINISRELKRLHPETIFLAPPAVLNNNLAVELDVKMIGNLSYRIYRKLRLPANLLWEQVDLPLWLKRHNNPPLLNLVNLAPLFYSNNFVTIHDLAFLLYPEYFSHSFALLYKLTVPRLVRNARHVFTVSNFSKKDLIQHLRVQEKKITTIYNAVDINSWRHDQIQPNPYSWPYILAVGALEPRKNLNRLITAFLKLNFHHLCLVIVGDENQEVFNQKSFSEQKNQLTPAEKQHIIFTGYLEDQQLSTLYSNAVCFCYPSLYEGFGLPPLEAQAMGCPVIVSNRASLPEVFGKSVLYCDPENVNDITEKLESVLGDDSLRQSLISSGFDNLKRFSWGKSAGIITEKIVGKKNGLGDYC